MKFFDLYPRRASGLPPGQRQLHELPRFSDKPLRWAPPVGAVELTISNDGEHLATLGLTQLHQFEFVEQRSDFHCVTTWSVRNLLWGGFRLTDILPTVVGQPLPYLVATAADRQSAIYRSEDLDRSDVLLATHLGGEPLTRRHGAPLRLVSPSQYGYKSPKHLVSLDFRSEEPESTLGPKEHLRARVSDEERHATIPNWLLRRPYRLMVAPTALAAERGLRNSPS